MKLRRKINCPRSRLDLSYSKLWRSAEGAAEEPVCGKKAMSTENEKERKMLEDRGVRRGA
jgi:hypothetical protein